MQRQRPLMVDDAPDVGAFVQHVAEAVGYDMQFTDRADGFKALYRSFHPDVVILDLAIPGTDGIELLIFLAAEDSSAQVLPMSGFGAEIREHRKGVVGGKGGEGRINPG